MTAVLRRLLPVTTCPITVGEPGAGATAFGARLGGRRSGDMHLVREHLSDMLDVVTPRFA
jgi:hypothetical protein